MDLNDWLSKQDWTVPVPLDQLSSLSPARLAVTALRPDLPLLVRQRAYHLFLQRREEYATKKDKNGEREHPLLDAPLDFALPSFLDHLSLAGLVLVQFNPATTVDAAEEAARLFFQGCRHAEADQQRAAEQDGTEKRLQLAVKGAGAPTGPQAGWDNNGLNGCAAGKGREETPQPTGLQLEGYKVEWEMGERVHEGAFCLSLHGDNLNVIETEGKNGLLIKAKDIECFTYIVNNVESDSSSRSRLTLCITVGKVYTTQMRRMEVVSVYLNVRRLSSQASAYAEVHGHIEKLSEKYSFPVATKQASTSPASAPSTKRSRSESSAPSSRVAKVPRRGSSPSTPNLEAPVFARYPYVGEMPTIVEWHPGFYIRQCAFIESVAPNEFFDFPFPTFSPEELAILSLSPDQSKLPPLPIKPVEVPRHYRFHSTERLALEHIYRPKLAIEETRTILLSDLYPALKAYALLVSKVVKARDAVLAAYQAVLEIRLYPRRHDMETADPIHQLIPLFERLKDDELYRKSCFSTGPMTLIRESKFSSVDIGVGPARRFEEKLKEIVAWEDKAALSGKKGL